MFFRAVRPLNKYISKMLYTDYLGVERALELKKQKLEQE